tara:strand:+ start:2025 stop:3572 length:1548 start_codon:yes stop_codon:yes gene_type:complete
MSIAVRARMDSLPTVASGRPAELWLSPAQLSYLRGLLVALFTTRLIGMVIVPFTDTTEARYAEIARKMLETGDWITPQFAYGVPFWGKPPLHTWLSAAGMGAFGVNEFAARLPIFLLACGLLALIYFWARAEKGNGFALVGTTVLASSALFFMASAVVMTDMPLVAGTTLSMVGFWNAVQRRSRHRVWGYLFFAGIAVGLLAKGPIAIALTGLPIGLWVILGKRRRETLRRLPWMTGLFLTFAVAAPWYIAAEIKTPGFLDYFLIGEHFQRFLVPGWTGDLYGSGHAKPRGTIWLFGILAFLPWSLFFLRPLFRIRTVVARFQADPSHWGSYLLVWALSPLIFFTAAGNIIVPYVLPALPAAALLLVQCWRDSELPKPVVSQRLAHGFKAVSGSLIAITAIAGIALAFSPELVSAKSQKQLVLAATRFAPPDVGDLTYWQDRFYSAEFYTAGKSKRIKTAAGLAPLLSDNRRDFFAVRIDAQADIPKKYLRHFTPVGDFGRVRLFLENPLKGTSQ